jgi:protein MPE1
MSYIHFKSVYNINYDKVTFDGVSLTLPELKKLIIEKSKFNKQVDFDLEITNADTNEGMFHQSQIFFINSNKIYSFFFNI